ncbi:MAG: hypothetical protein ACYCYO_15985 [Bacilli bacterium]
MNQPKGSKVRKNAWWRLFWSFVVLVPSSNLIARGAPWNELGLFTTIIAAIIAVIAVIRLIRTRQQVSK